MSLSKKFAFLLLVAALLAAGGLQAASAIDTFGINPADMATGNASSAVGGDETSLTYAAAVNPALLAAAARPLFGLNASYSNLHLSDLGHPKGPDASGLAASPYRPSQAEGLRATTFGLNLPLFQGVNFGMAGYLPGDKLASIQAFSSQDVGYLRFDDRQRKPEIHTALGIDVGHGIALGAGAYYTVSASGDVQIALSDKDSQGRMGLAMQPVATPYGGMLWGKKLFAGEGRLDVAATYRDEQKTDAALHTTFSASNEALSLPAGIDAALVAFYDPAVARAATGLQYGPSTLFLAYERAYWSRYRSAQLRLYGDDIILLQGKAPQREENFVRLQDTDSYQLGFAFKEDVGRGRMALRLGYEQHGSALPGNVEQPLIVDLASDVYAAGVGYQLAGVQKWNSLAFDLGYQWTRLRSRRFIDARGEPYRAGGQLSTVIGGCRLEL